jgi:hypothetical protein
MGQGRGRQRRAIFRFSDRIEMKTSGIQTRRRRDDCDQWRRCYEVDVGRRRAMLHFSTGNREHEGHHELGNDVTVILISYFKKPFFLQYSVSSFSTSEVSER